MAGVTDNVTEAYPGPRVQEIVASNAKPRSGRSGMIGPVRHSGGEAISHRFRGLDDAAAVRQIAEKLELLAHVSKTNTLPDAASTLAEKR